MVNIFLCMWAFIYNADLGKQGSFCHSLSGYSRDVFSQSLWKKSPADAPPLENGNITFTTSHNVSQKGIFWYNGKKFSLETILNLKKYWIIWKAVSVACFLRISCISYLNTAAATWVLKSRQLAFCLLHSTSRDESVPPNIILFQISFQEEILTTTQRIPFNSRLVIIR